MKEVVGSLKKITKERIENTMKKLFTSETFWNINL